MRLFVVSAWCCFNFFFFSQGKPLLCVFGEV